MSRLRVRKLDSCDLCRFDLVEFLVEVRLPRFTMAAGERWDRLARKVQPDGRFSLGGGTVQANEYRVVQRNVSRTCGRKCGCK